MIGIFAVMATTMTSPVISCEALQAVTLPDTSITAEAVPAVSFTWPEGAFRIPGSGNEQPLPVYCRVNMVLRPTADSQINVELWLPEKPGTENSWPRVMGYGAERFMVKMICRRTCAATTPRPPPIPATPGLP